MSPAPDVCPAWTCEQAAEYHRLVGSGVYPELAAMIVNWNESCAYNASLIGVKWEPPAECYQAPVPKKPWWKFW